MAKQTDADTFATLETSKGPIRVRLFPDTAPNTVENFNPRPKDWDYNKPAWVIR